MAYEIGTATGVEDLLAKITTFLTTNATLVGLNQEWQVVRSTVDNVASIDTNLNSNNLNIAHTFNADPMLSNVSAPTSSGNVFYASNYSVNLSYFTLRLRQAKQVRKIVITSAHDSYFADFMPTSFNLHGSNDGSSWTLVHSPSFTKPGAGNKVIISVPASTNYEYWRVTITGGGYNATYLGWYSFLMYDVSDNIVNSYGSNVIFKSRGFAANQEIFTGIKSVRSSTGGWENLILNGFTGYDPSVESWYNQPGAMVGYGIPEPRACPMVPGWPGAMKYWFVASGNSFRLALKVSNTYESGYLGFLMPYATPGQYPYPLVVGGSHLSNSSDFLYSYAHKVRGVYCCPGSNTGSASSSGSGTLNIRSGAGDWLQYADADANSSNEEDISGITVADSTIEGMQRCVWPHSIYSSPTGKVRPYRDCYGGGYMFQPCIPIQRGPTRAVLGELEGTYFVSGFNVTSEDTSTIGGKVHVIFQNTYRTTLNNYWALALE